MHYSLCGTLILASATLLAILISHYILKRENKRNEKLMILKQLMVYRKNDTEEFHKELEQVLNLIDIVFVREKTVLDKYHNLRDVYLCSSAPNPSVNDLYAALLKEIALSLHYKIVDIDLDKCVGWEDLQKQAQPYLKK